jgi:glutaminyl-peptide cyclotransferase
MLKISKASRNEQMKINASRPLELFDKTKNMHLRFNSCRPRSYHLRPPFLRMTLFCTLPLVLSLALFACQGSSTQTGAINANASASQNVNANAAATATPAPSSTTSATPPISTAFDGERAFAHVRQMVEFGPRPPGSKELEQTRNYIINELKSYGLNVTTDEFNQKTPVGNRKMVNIVAELAGDAPDIIIIASHYDTKFFKNIRFVGANDAGSSSGALLEIARVLAERKLKPRVTYRFVFFDGEEAFCKNWEDCGKPDAPDNTYGSRHYVSQLVGSGELKRVRAMILLDMIGYKNLEIGKDTMGTRWLIDAIWQTARELGYKQFVDRPEGVGGDDHEPFLRAGVDAVDIIQLSNYGYWHTADDTLDKVSPESLKVVGDVIVASLPRIEDHILQSKN